MGTFKGALAVAKTYVKLGLGLHCRAPLPMQELSSSAEVGASYAFTPRTPKGAPLKGTSTIPLTRD